MRQAEIIDGGAETGPLQIGREFPGVYLDNGDAQLYAAALAEVLFDYVPADSPHFEILKTMVYWLESSDAGETLDVDASRRAVNGAMQEMLLRIADASKP